MINFNDFSIIFICIIAVFIDIFLLVDSRSSLLKKYILLIKVRYITITGIFQTVSYLIEYIFCLYDFLHDRPFGMFLQCMCYISNLAFIICFADLVYTKYHKMLKNVGISRFLFLLPSFICLFFEMINFYYPIFFDIDPVTFEYSETSNILYINLIPTFYVLFTLVNDIKELVTKYYYSTLPISAFFILTIVGCTLEAYLPDIPFVPIFCSLTLILLYMKLLKSMGKIDECSGVFSKNELVEYFEKFISKSKKKYFICGIHFDIENLKLLNHDFGYETGDKIIKSVGQSLITNIKRNGYCFRYNDDDFLVLFRFPKNNIKSIKELITQIKSDCKDCVLTEKYEFYDVKNDNMSTFLNRLELKI